MFVCLYSQAHTTLPWCRDPTWLPQRGLWILHVVCRTQHQGTFNIDKLVTGWQLNTEKPTITSFIQVDIIAGLLYCVALNGTDVSNKVQWTSAVGAGQPVRRSCVTEVHHSHLPVCQMSCLAECHTVTLLTKWQQRGVLQWMSIWLQSSVSLAAQMLVHTQMVRPNYPVQKDAGSMFQITDTDTAFPSFFLSLYPAC